jgi:hypothetical protein
MSFSTEAARDLAMRALVHMSEQPEVIAGFFGASGLQPDDLRGLVGDPQLALHVLDYLLEDDRRVLDTAEALDTRPENLLRARTVLAGPGSHGWEAD